MRASAPSLWPNPMPPRITPESYRPRVSDRTMVANFGNRYACRFEPRMASSRIMSMKPPRIGTYCLVTSARGPGQSAARHNRAGGLDARKDPRRPAGGEKCLLTSPFIGPPDVVLSEEAAIANVALERHRPGLMTVQARDRQRAPVGTARDCSPTSRIWKLARNGW